MLVVLLLAAGAAWESTALTVLEREPDLVVLRRCVDVADLLAAASAGQADVAVLALDAPGLDPGAVDQLRRFQLRPVAVLPAEGLESHALRLARLGIRSAVDVADLEGLPSQVRSGEDADLDTVVPDPLGPLEAGEPPALPAGGRGRVIVVWGPAGAPGRSSVAVAVAAELAERRRRTTLVDADPYGGTIAQQLGVLDEVSGLLAAARLAAAGGLEARFGSVQRALGDHLTVVSGLPRPDRWVEVRPGALEHLLDVASAHGDVVVDTGFSVEVDPMGELGSRPGRNHLTLAALASADEVLVVGSADPVGLARLARGVADVHDLVVGATLRVVVNRMRPSLGWSAQEVIDTIATAAPAGIAGVHFLPDESSVVDRALVAGRTWTEVGDSALRRSVSELVDAVAPTTRSAARGRRARGRTGSRRRVRPRTAGRDRRW